ncbi:transcription factor bHLH18-like [Abrus precatorius]|uniref:Transcription factor bHLH18-like n=1 Tax=Abrus precatorius TaxID=3816 RepID=A0A8B8L9H3_ABRPR|nr:transcription factor bHLH18-like [Abrus precatorius]
MENLCAYLVSHAEMGDDDFLNESSFNEEEFLKDIIVEQPVFSHESDSPSSNPSSSSVQSNYKMVKSCNNLKPHSSSPTGYILSFDNPVDYSAFMCSKSRAPSHYCTDPPTKKTRNSSGTQVHILAERKRRQELTRSIIALSTIIPSLKKTDKANVLREAVNYVKQLQERVKELENQSKKECVDSIILIKKTQLCINDEATLSCDGCNGCIVELPEVEAMVLEREVLIGIHCEKQKHSFLKILSLLSNLHLSITSTSILPFGTSTAKITIVAQMDDGYNMTIDDLVRTLRQHLLSLKSQDMQK